MDMSGAESGAESGAAAPATMRTLSTSASSVELLTKLGSE